MPATRMDVTVLINALAREAAQQLDLAEATRLGELSRLSSASRDLPDGVRDRLDELIADAKQARELCLDQARLEIQTKILIHEQRGISPNDPIGLAVHDHKLRQHAARLDAHVGCVRAHATALQQSGPLRHARRRS